MKQTVSTNQKGFTLIELLIATTVFAVILMAATATLIQVGRMYYKGVITSKTQNVARTVIDDVSRSIQFGSGSISRAVGPSNPQLKAICMGSTRYTYVEGAQVGEAIPHGLWQDKIGTEACSNDLPNLFLVDPYQDAVNKDRDGRELLEDDMRLQNFSIDQQGGSSDVFTVRVKVVYGDDDLLNDVANPTGCKGSIVGGQWCAISDLSSVVYSRAN